MGDRYANKRFMKYLIFSAVILLSAMIVVSCNAGPVVEESAEDSNSDISETDEAEQGSEDAKTEEPAEQKGELINLKASGRVEDNGIVIEGTIDVVGETYVMVAIEKVGSWCMAGSVVIVDVNDGHFKYVAPAHNLGGEGVKIWVSFMYMETIRTANLLRNSFKNFAEEYIEKQPEEVIELYGKEGENIIDKRIVEFMVTQ